MSVGRQQINTSTEDGKVNIENQRSAAMSVFKVSGSKPDEILSRVVFANTISNSGVPDAKAVGRRKKGTDAGDLYPARYFFRQFQNVDTATFALAQ
jgi:hypothetical protein